MRQELRSHTEQQVTGLRQELRAPVEDLNHQDRRLLADLGFQVQLVAEGVTTVPDQWGGIIENSHTAREGRVR